MKNNNVKSRKHNQSLLIMGFIWIAIALFGLIFDPGKRVIIISQFAIGGLCLIIFIVTKLKKN